MRRRPDPLRAALAFLLLGTAALYLWDLDVSGYANDYYSAAVQAGTTSWKAFLFGGLDAGGFSTVDKPPLSLWPMVLVSRVWGFGPTSVLLPQALEGVAAVWLLHDCVRRATGSRVPALLAGTCLAVTPVATLMFRYNNPDALLTLLMVGAAWCTLRALQSERRPQWWLVVGGMLVGLGFLTKMFEGVLVVPGLVGAYAVYARCAVLVRFRHLVVAGLAAVVSGGWWVVLVQLWPAASRPYVGGSTTDSVMQLALGYNGVSRLTGTGSISYSTQGLRATNLARVARTDIAPEVLWFVPAALVLGCAGWWLARGREPAVRASFALWWGWLLSAGTTFVVMAGIFHSYYAVLLTPALSALAGTGAWLLWQRRRAPGPRRVLGVATALTALTSGALVGVAGGPFRWLAVPIVLLGLAPLVRRARWPDRAVLAAAVVSVLAGPLAFSVATAGSSHGGPAPEAGPTNGVSAGLVRAWGLSLGTTSTSDVADPSATDLLRGAPPTTTWVAAVPGASTSAAYELATGRPVLAIGGYKGTDPTPSLGQFEHLVGTGQVGYLLVRGTSGPASSAILSWASTHFVQRQVGAVSYYDLSMPLDLP